MKKVWCVFGKSKKSDNKKISVKNFNLKREEREKERKKSKQERERERKVIFYFVFIFEKLITKKHTVENLFVVGQWGKQKHFHDIRLDKSI